MTELELIKIVAGSSFFGAVFGSGITSLVNWLLSKRNFKFKSYEEIVKKRFSAYEKLSRVSLFLNMNVQEDDGIIVPFAFTSAINQLEGFQIMITEAFTQTFWLNEKTGEIFTELNVYVYNINSEAASTSDPERALKEIAALDREKISDISKRLNRQLREDLVSLHDVEKFVKRTTGPKRKYPVMSYKSSTE